jgi:hypothetical protein
MRATSAEVSAPISFAGRVLPSDMSTSILLAEETTWALVRIVPFESMITPEPVPEPPRRVTLIDTTLGDTAATTSASDPVCVATTAGVRAVAAACAGSLSNRVATTPPTTPLESIRPSTPAAMATRLPPPPGRRGAAVAVCVP